MWSYIHRYKLIIVMDILKMKCHKKQGGAILKKYGIIIRIS